MSGLWVARKVLASPSHSVAGFLTVPVGVTKEKLELLEMLIGSLKTFLLRTCGGAWESRTPCVKHTRDNSHAML